MAAEADSDKFSMFCQTRAYKRTFPMAR